MVIAVIPHSGDNAGPSPDLHKPAEVTIYLSVRPGSAVVKVALSALFTIGCLQISGIVLTFALGSIQRRKLTDLQISKVLLLLLPYAENNRTKHSGALVSYPCTAGQKSPCVVLSAAEAVKTADLSPRRRQHCGLMAIVEQS